MEMALKTISETLHAAFDRHPKWPSGTSKGSCVQSSQTVEAFLRHIGFKDARSVAVALVLVRKTKDRTLGVSRIGSEDGKPNGRPGWNGHMVVLVDGYLIDPTFWQIDKKRKFPTMIALPIAPPGPKELNLTPLARLAITHDGDPVSVTWLETPKNTSWPICENDPEISRIVRTSRQEVALTLANQFR